MWWITSEFSHWREWECRFLRRVVKQVMIFLKWLLKGHAIFEVALCWVSKYEFHLFLKDNAQQKSHSEYHHQKTEKKTDRCASVAYTSTQVVHQPLPKRPSSSKVTTKNSKLKSSGNFSQLWFIFCARKFKFLHFCSFSNSEGHSWSKSSVIILDLIKVIIS